MVLAHSVASQSDWALFDVYAYAHVPNTRIQFRSFIVSYLLFDYWAL